MSTTYSAEGKGHACLLLEGKCSCDEVKVRVDERTWRAIFASPTLYLDKLVPRVGVPHAKCFVEACGGEPLAVGQGLTLVHISARPKPFWTHLPVSPV
jgi:hypothetical protein